MMLLSLLFPVRRRTALCLLAASACLTATAAANVVKTLAGETYEGEVHWDNGAVTITTKGQPVQRVDLANILKADFSVRRLDSGDGIGPGVQLRSGGVVGGKIISIDAKVVRIQTLAGPQDFPIANAARILFDPMPDAVARKIPAGFVGAIVPGGDLLEGEFRGMDDKPPQVRINSPILGVHRFALRAGEILGVALRDVAAPAAPDAYKLVSIDGSAFGTPSVLASGDTVSVRDPIVGEIKISGKQLAQITAGPAKVLTLGSLKAQGVGSVQPAKVPATFAADSLPGGGAIKFGDHVCDGGITQAAGVSVTYAIPQGFSVFAAQAGLPTGAAPGVTVVFVVSVDGRPVWRSQPVAGGSAPVPVRWTIGTSARLLSLTVEPAQPAALGTLAAWGDAMLIKP